jgi:lysophospholipase L1-like esterase
MKVFRLTPLLLLPVLLGSFMPPKPTKEITWTAIGDSFTYLNDHLNESQDRVTKGWITRTTELIPGLKYTNQGHNYWTTVEIADHIDQFNLQPADVYTIFLGTNDWMLGVPLGTLADYTNSTGTGTLNGAYRVIVNKLRSLNPNAHIILFTPMQRGDFVYILNPRINCSGSYKDMKGQSLESFADAMRNIADKENFTVVDLYHEPRLALNFAVKFKYLRDPKTNQYKEYPYPEYTNISFKETDEYPYPVRAMDTTYDGVHPSDKGSAIVAELVAKAIESLNL